MVKTPEEYFSEQSLTALPVTTSALTAAERAFVEKYLGSDALQSLPNVVPPVQADLEQTVELPSPVAEQPLRSRLAEMEQLQMVSFFVRKHIYLLPVLVIVEVLRSMPVTRLPMAPRYMAGVINLRGKITPLLHLDALLTSEGHIAYTPKSSIIICSASGMHIGLIFDKLHTMYLVDNKKISWNVEAYLGSGAEFLCGMADIQDHLYAIIDPETIVNKMLSE